MAKFRRSGARSRIRGFGAVSSGKVAKALTMKGPGQVKRIFKTAKKAFDVGDNKNARALWAIAKKRLIFLKKVH